MINSGGLRERERGARPAKREIIEVLFYLGWFGRDRERERLVV